MLMPPTEKLEFYEIESKTFQTSWLNMSTGLNNSLRCEYTGTVWAAYFKKSSCVEHVYLFSCHLSRDSLLARCYDTRRPHTSRRRIFLSLFG